MREVKAVMIVGLLWMVLTVSLYGAWRIQDLPEECTVKYSEFGEKYTSCSISAVILVYVFVWIVSTLLLHFLYLNLVITCCGVRIEESEGGR